MAIQKKVSLRKYGELCGSNHVTVGKAVKEGRIVDGWDAEHQKIIVAEADKEWGNAFMAEVGFVRPVQVEEETEVAEVVKGPATEKVKKDISSGGWNGGEIPMNIKFPEALRIERILMARKKKLEVDELEGVLVRKAVIERQLYVAGIEIRKRFEQLPVRVVDDVRAAKTRLEAVTKLEDFVTKTLIELNGVISDLIKNEEIIEEENLNQNI